ncbi:hypothetical protein GGR53DRAFT_483269 [Hypoxylon sp. FL1150]|nr:hypothetical protein GGR53DRAFT_483269 [Hypoxylon sp. FL1150]
MSDSWYRIMSMIRPAVLQTKQREKLGEFHNNGSFQLPRPERDLATNAIVREQMAKLPNISSGKRKVLVLEMGYLGSGPERMEENDEIYWILGVAVPMILRRSTQHPTFTVIGPAFVHDRELVPSQSV